MAKVSPPITLKILKSAQTAGVASELADGACPGLRIRVGAAGKMTWSLLTRDAVGKRVRVEVGSWPEIGVPEAREIANKLKHETKRETVATNELTLDDVLSLYGKSPAGAKKSWSESDRCIRKVFADHIKDRSTGLVATTLQRTADAYASITSASAAIRYIRPVFKWAEKRGMTPKGLWRDIDPIAAVNRRDRVLSDEELKLVLKHLGMHGHDGAARMMLLTATRREEVCQMRFEDIIEDVWYVPAEIRKTGGELHIPLTPYVQTLMGAQGRTSGLVFVGDKGKPLDNWDRWQKKFNERSGTSGWHRHDLRRTAATIMGKNGVAPHIVEIALGHKDPHTQLAGIYNQSRYEQEHEEALQVLSDVISGLEMKALGKI